VFVYPIVRMHACVVLQWCSNGVAVLVHFLTRIHHPNIDRIGRICLVSTKCACFATTKCAYVQCLVCKCACFCAFIFVDRPHLLGKHNVYFSLFLYFGSKQLYISPFFVYVGIVIFALCLVSNCLFFPFRVFGSLYSFLFGVVMGGCWWYDPCFVNSH
jgi:hypothetical protein